MAITWNVTITPLDISRKEASVTATRTDSVTGSVETHNIITCLLVTTVQKTVVLNQLWDMHLTEQAKQTAIAAYIGDLEAQAKANLEARE